VDQDLAIAEADCAHGRHGGGSHLCLIYNSESERRNAIATYLETGIRNGERIVYIADRVTVSEFASLLEDLGMDGSALSSAEDLEVRQAEASYCPGGQFSPKQMLDLLRATQIETGAAGYPCLRVSGEMSWALRGIRGSERLIEYESQVNELMASHPFSAVCQYDARLFNGQTLYHILQVHPYVIVRGRALKNPCYIGHAEFSRRL
jgi:hypothetical protein